MTIFVLTFDCLKVKHILNERLIKQDFNGYRL